MNVTSFNGDYQVWLEGIKRSVRGARAKAALAANRAMILVYWEIGRGILQRQAEQGWAAQVIDRLARDLTSAFPGDNRILDQKPQIHEGLRCRVARSGNCATACGTIALGT